MKSGKVTALPLLEVTYSRQRPGDGRGSKDAACNFNVPLHGAGHPTSWIRQTRMHDANTSRGRLTRIGKASRRKNEARGLVLRRSQVDD